MALQVGDNGSKNLVFGIGGPYGHSSDVRTRADEMIKLSDMVLNHQVRLTLLPCARSKRACLQMLPCMLCRLHIWSWWSRYIELGPYCVVNHITTDLHLCLYEKIEVVCDCCHTHSKVVGQHKLRARIKFLLS